MPVSVVDPIGKSFERTRAMLFAGGGAKKWFVMGFCAFLAGLVQGGGGNGFNWTQRMGRGQTSPAQALDWLHTNFTSNIEY